MRVFLVIVLLVLLSGCISDQSKEVTTAGDESPTDEEIPTEQWTQKEEEAIMKQISISSDAFKNSSNMPVDYTCDGDDHSPALLWKGLPEGTRSIALIVD
ncbi:MAG: hypothetical protein KAJ39_07620, partial [Gammaproteobacteria bacterium]|nr:hypothetical protein [Gammaproteobacteria bacterium]